MTPFLVSAFPIGMIFGVLAISVGLSMPETLAMSMIVNSGTAQFVGLKLLADGANWAVILLTVSILTLRMLIYSTMLVPLFTGISQRWRVILGFGLIDAVFFILVERFKREESSSDRRWYFLGTVVSPYVVWCSATIVGMTAGAALSAITDLGLDFPMIAVFIAMMASAMVNWKVWAAVVSAGSLIMITYHMPYHLGTIVAGLGGAAVGILCERYEAWRRPRAEAVAG